MENIDFANRSDTKNPSQKESPIQPSVYIDYIVVTLYPNIRFYIPITITNIPPLLLYFYMLSRRQIIFPLSRLFAFSVLKSLPPAITLRLICRLSFVSANGLSLYLFRTMKTILVSLSHFLRYL